MNGWRKAAIWCALVGFTCWIPLFVTGVGHPHILFRVLMPLGLLLVFLALPLLVISWIVTVYQEVRAKNYLIVAVEIAAALLLLFWQLPKFFV